MSVESPATIDGPTCEALAETFFVVGAAFRKTGVYDPTMAIGATLITLVNAVLTYPEWARGVLVQSNFLEGMNEARDDTHPLDAVLEIWPTLVPIRGFLQDEAQR